MKKTYKATYEILGNDILGYVLTIFLPVEFTKNFKRNFNFELIDLYFYYKDENKLTDDDVTILQVKYQKLKNAIERKDIWKKQVEEIKNLIENVEEIHIKEEQFF